MPTNTYTALAAITLTSTNTEIIFAGIPDTYRDLIIVANFAQTSSVEEVIYLRFNGDSSNGTMAGMRGNGSTGASYSGSSMFLSYAGGLSTSRGNATVQIFDYAMTNKHKRSLVRCDITPLKSEAMSNRWASNAAVNSVSIVCQSTPFAIGSTFSLYGVIA